MSQNNVNFGVDPTGSQLLDELLTDEQQNNLTVHGGTVRPEYAMVGTIWTDKSVEGVATLKRFNGTSDDVLLSVNSVEGVATVEKALLYNSKYKYSKNAVVINATDSEVKLYKSLVADNVGNALSDVESWEEISLGGGVDLNTGDKIYDWIGTKAEYEEQQIETLHPEYLCFITDDETPIVCATRSLDNLDEAGQAKFDAKADVDLDNLSIVGQAKFDAKADVSALAAKLDREGNYTVVDTYRNGANWYRVWSDGWIEQGGVWSGVAVNSSAARNLLKAFATTDYSCILQPFTGAFKDNGIHYVVSKTTTKTTISGFGTSSGNLIWFACGY